MSKVCNRLKIAKGLLKLAHQEYQQQQQPYLQQQVHQQQQLEPFVCTSADRFRILCFLNFEVTLTFKIFVAAAAAVADDVAGVAAAAAMPSL